MIVVSRFNKTNHLQGSQLQEEYYTEVSKPGKFLYHKNFNKVREKSGYKKPAFGREIRVINSEKGPSEIYNLCHSCPSPQSMGIPVTEPY